MVQRGKGKGPALLPTCTRLFGDQGGPAEAPCRSSRLRPDNIIERRNKYKSLVGGVNSTFTLAVAATFGAAAVVGETLSDPDAGSGSGSVCIQVAHDGYTCLDK